MLSLANELVIETFVLGLHSQAFPSIQSVLLESSAGLNSGHDVAHGLTAGNHRHL